MFSPEFACTVIPEGKHPDITGGVVSCGADPPVVEKIKKEQCLNQSKSIKLYSHKNIKYMNILTKCMEDWARKVILILI